VLPFSKWQVFGQDMKFYLLTIIHTLIYIQFWPTNLPETEHFEQLFVDAITVLKFILEECDMT
jgi:hypothetical protein